MSSIKKAVTLAAGRGKRKKASRLPLVEAVQVGLQLAAWWRARKEKR